METIVVKKVYLYEVPKHKYKNLLEDLQVEKLFHLEQFSDEFNHAMDTLEEIMIERTTEEIEIDDGDY